MKFHLKIISILVSLLLSTNTIVYSLGTMPVTEKPHIKKEWDAAGRKLFAARWTECTIAFDPYYKPIEFMGEPGPRPAGISAIKKANYKQMPESWKKSSFFQEVLIKNRNYEKINYGEIKEVEQLLVKAFKYYRSHEAQIPQELVDIKIDYFEVKEEAGEVPISRIEKYEDGTYALVIHPTFARTWADLLINDIWIKYDGFVDKKQPQKKQNPRYVSLAWGIFYRIAKHEMSDLDKKTKVSKGDYRGHLTSYPETEDMDSLLSEPLFFENPNEEEANNISGNYAGINDSIWLWFLGSYCSEDPVRYDNETLKKRIDWIFTSKVARKNSLHKEFPLLNENLNLRGWAKALALNINHEYFSRENIRALNGGVLKRKEKNLIIFYKNIARYLVTKKNRKQLSGQKEQEVLKIIQNNLPDYVAAGFNYAIDNGGVKPTSLQDIESKLKNKNIKGVDVQLDGLMKYLAINIIKTTINENFLHIRDKLLYSGASTEVDQFVSDAFYHCFGEKVYFLTTNGAEKKIREYIKALSRESTENKYLYATGKNDEDNEDYLYGIFSTIVGSEHLQQITRSLGYFTKEHLFSGETYLNLPAGYNRQQAVEDIDAMVEKGWFSSVKIGKEVRYARTRVTRDSAGEFFKVEKGVLDLKLDDPKVGFEENISSFLMDQGIFTIRELIILSREDILGTEVWSLYSGKNRTETVKGASTKIVAAVQGLGLNLKHYSDKHPEGWEISVLDLKLKNLFPVIGKPLATHIMDKGIISYRQLIAKTEGEISRIITGYVATQSEVKIIVEKIKDDLNKLGLSLSPVGMGPEDGSGKYYGEIENKKKAGVSGVIGRVLKKAGDITGFSGKKGKGNRDDVKKELGINKDKAKLQKQPFPAAEKKLEDIISEYILDVKDEFRPESAYEPSEEKSTNLLKLSKKECNQQSPDASHSEP